MYNTLGLSINKYNQFFLLVFSFLLIGVNYIIGSSFYFWTFLIVMILIINVIWYLFSDIKWNKEEFIIEKFLMRKKIPSKEFVKVQKLLFNIFIITFTGKKYYYFGNFMLFSENDFDTTAKIKSILLD